MNPYRDRKKFVKVEPGFIQRTLCSRDLNHTVRVTEVIYWDRTFLYLFGCWRACFKFRMECIYCERFWIVNDNLTYMENPHRRRAEFEKARDEFIDNDEEARAYILRWIEE